MLASRLRKREAEFISNGGKRRKKKKTRNNNVIGSRGNGFLCYPVRGKGKIILINNVKRDTDNNSK